MEAAQKYLQESADIIGQLDHAAIENVAEGLAEVQYLGRLFILGVGGSAATASHAVNDFRKLCGIEAYAPTDNVSELTARTNDDGWDSVFAEWLLGSQLCDEDAVLVVSVGGGDSARGVSRCLVRALELAASRRVPIYGIVGRDGGYTRGVARACVVIPPLYPERVTPHTEGIASVVLHLLASHPRLQRKPGKWESVK